MLTKYLDQLQLNRLGDDQPAGLWITSLPWPRTKADGRSLGGQPTYVEALGQWPGEEAGSPRRLLMIADGQNQSPQQVQLGKAAAPAGELPTAESEQFGGSDDPAFIVEQSMLRIRHGKRSVGLAMGLRVAGEVHWWEATKLVTLSETPTCRVVEMGGAIPHEIFDKETLFRHPGIDNPFLHRHNWVNGRIIARLHSNGVCEIYAHHINSRSFDDGLALRDAVPVVGIAVDGAPAESGAPMGAWDGSESRIDMGNVKFDLTDASHLATEEQPGRFDAHEKFVVWQPYEAMELYGGAAALGRTGDAYVYRASQKVIGRGMARTLRFSLSLSDRSPRIARYVAPAWWYGLCEELVPDSLLPVSSDLDEDIDNCRDWLNTFVQQGGFEDGSVPRSAWDPNKPRRRNRPESAKKAAFPDRPDRAKMPKNEPGWEGDVTYGQFLTAWRTGDARGHDLALRSAYHFTDIAVDHAMKLVRMHGWPPPATSLPGQRMLGTIAAWLETGDPYLYETACAVMDNAYWMHKNSWPRMAVGRDGCFFRGSTMLYRYTADEHYRRIAYDGCMAVVHAQLPDGSFGDQGGGTGIHMRSGYVVKPWMGTLAISPVIDYLELFPDDEQLLQCVKRFGDWLVANRWERNGTTTWSYQHAYGPHKRHFTAQRRDWVELPTEGPWHSEALARILGYCTMRTGDPAYLDAWAHSREGRGRHHGGDHGVSAATQYLPWLQMRLWQARPSGNGVAVEALNYGPRTSPKAKVLAPDSTIELQWTDDLQVQAETGAAVQIDAKVLTKTDQVVESLSK